MQNLSDPIPNPSPAGEGSPHAQATAAASAVASSPSRGIPKAFGKRGSVIVVVRGFTIKIQLNNYKSSKLKFEIYIETSRAGC